MKDVRGQKITLVSTMKDEGPYILDWVSHYKALGFTDIVVFTNDCSDPTDHILRVLNRIGVVEHRFNRVMKRGPHKSALMWAEYEPTVRASDWLFVADVDEFLDLTGDAGTIQDLLADLPEADAISFVWRIFGNAGVRGIKDGPVPRLFTRAEAAEGAPGEHRFFKTMFRNDGKFARMGVHRPFLAEGAQDVRWVLPDGHRLSEEEVEKALFVRDHYGYEAAQLNHYALRSLDAFLNKRLRGRANHHKSEIQPGYWPKFDRNQVEDTGLRQRFRSSLEVKQFILDEAPELYDLHEEALAWHRKRARRAWKDDGIKDFVAQLGVDLSLFGDP